MGFPLYPFGIGMPLGAMKAFGSNPLCFVGSMKGRSIFENPLGAFLSDEKTNASVFSLSLFRKLTRSDWSQQNTKDYFQKLSLPPKASLSRTDIKESPCHKSQKSRRTPPQKKCLL